MMPAGSLNVASLPLSASASPTSPVPANVWQFFFATIEHFDLVVVRIGDVQLAVVKRDTQRMLQPHARCRCRRRRRNRTANPRRPPASRTRPLDLNGTAADRAPFAVGDEQPLAVGREAARLRERGKSRIELHRAATAAR